MFKYDSVHGRWPGIVQRKENRLIIDGKVGEGGGVGGEFKPVLLKLMVGKVVVMCSECTIERF